MSRRSGSIFWSLVLISIGLLFLLSNLRVLQEPWVFIGKYWPLLIIFWGLSKLFAYFQAETSPSEANRSLLRGGDVVLLLLILLVGGAITKLVSRDWGFPPLGRIHIGEGDVDLGWNNRQTFNFSEEAAQPLAAGEASLEIVNAYGNVDVNVHDSPEIKVKLEKRIKVDSEAQAKDVAGQLKLKIEKKGKGYSITTNRDALGEEFRRGLKTNLSVWVPKKMAVTLNNLYGDVSLLAISGNQHLTNGYGSLTVKNVEGNLLAENKYGNVVVYGVTGDCNVINKNSGIEVENVGGKATLEGGYGSIVLRKVKGAVKLDHRYGSVECNDLDNTLVVEGRYAQVKASNVAGDVTVVTSFRGVELENVQGTLTVQGKHGDVEISSESLPSKPIKVEAEYSGVSITIPRASQFKFDGFSKYGKLESDFEEIKGSDFGSDKRVSGAQGKNGPQITINTTYRDIHLNAS